MDLVFGHAIYGEHERGHRLLRASPAFPKASALAGRMDMQGTPPPHAAWQPYLSAFAWEDLYILARTMPDPKATRPGMVFSRAFAITSKDVSLLDNILGMAELLAELGDKRDDIVDVPYQASKGALVKDLGLIRALLSGAPRPLVWPGQTGFEPAFAGLWEALWPAARRNFTTRIAFSPSDVAVEPPTLITSPSELLSRWSGTTIVEPDPGGVPCDAAERYLAGIERNEIQTALVEAFGDDTPDIEGIRRLVEMESSLHEGASFAESLDALRLAGHLGATLEKADAIKRGLIDRATIAVARASAAEIRMARNLDLAAFQTRTAFWEGLAQWSKTNLLLDRDHSVAAQLLVDAWSGKPQGDWCAAVIKGVIGALSRPGAEILVRLWKILAAQPTLLTPITRGLTTTRARALEAALVEHLPAKMSGDMFDEIARQALTLNFELLHAACCAAALPPGTAIRRHLAEMTSTDQSVRLASRKAKGSELVTAALGHKDDVTLILAAEAAAAAPALLKRLDVTVLRWRDLWREALVRNAQAALGPSDPAGTASALFDRLIAGKFVEQPLLTALSKSPLADLAYLHARDELWAKIAEPGRSAFLEATARGWLAAIERGEARRTDPVLAQHIMTPTLLDPTLGRLASHPAAGCTLFKALPQIPESRCVRWFREVLSRSNPLSVEDAAALGLLASSRNWTTLANEISDAITDSGRHDLKPAVDYIVELIGMVRRYYLDELGSTMPLAAKWQVLEEVVVELYGGGPSDNRLWQRAGGKDKDIPKGTSGADIWRKVFAEAKKGKAAVKISEMIKRMYEDYSGYRPVQILRWDRSFEKR